MKQKFVLLAALACGVLAALMARAWLDSRDAEREERFERRVGKVQSIEVLGVNKPIPKGATLKLEDLVLINTFVNALTARALMPDDADAVLGRKVAFSLSAESPILWEHLEGGERGVKGLSNDIHAGMRAVSVPVSGAAAVSGLVLPNDRVDVLGTFVFGASDDPKASELVTLTVLQNVTVLATGMETAKSVASGGYHAGGYSTVTLEVTPREAEVLVFAQQMKGRLSLTLRNPSDIYYEKETPRIDFQKIEGELKSLNDYRQSTLRGNKP